MPTMDGFRTQSRSFIEAAVVGLLACAVLYVPPASIAARLDGWSFDLWSRLQPPPAPSNILLLDLDTAALQTLVDAAERQSAELLISTSPHAPPAPSAIAIGPVEVPIGMSRSHPTAWLRGGHLRFEPDVDGVVRQDQSLPSGRGTIASLPLYAAHTLATERGQEPPAEPTTRQLLRFHAAHAFAEERASVALEAPETLAGKIVIAGAPEPKHATPVGFLSTPELVADVLSNHMSAAWLATSPAYTSLAWCAALALLLGLAFGLPAKRATTWWALGFAFVLLPGGSLLAFHSASIWLPVTGPAAWLAITGSLIALRRPVLASSEEETGESSEALIEARRAAADGRYADAWLRYRQLSANPRLLPELYELASELAEQGARREATDLYHRIAQVDGRFRDVAKRLVEASQPENHTTEDDPPPMPETLGRYQLLEPIGRGAMGYVYLGRDPIINRIVALKAIDLTLDYDGEELESVSESFLREATMAGNLSHQNIVTIYDVGETGGLAYIAMEYLKGQRLSEFGTPETLLPIDTVLELLSRAAAALDYAHRQNIVHRDIKPANIMYDSVSDSLKITDFGIAKLIDANRTRTGIVLGTPAFMSPEQLEGKNVNGHTDLFALGVSLYQLLTGCLPFRGASMTKLMFVIANEPHESVTKVRTDLPKWLDGVLDRALAKDPSERFQSGAEMAAAMRAGMARVA